MDTLEKLRYRQERVKSGKLNCIPLWLERFRAYLPGIEKGRYNLYVAAQKVKEKFI